MGLHDYGCDVSTGLPSPNNGLVWPSLAQNPFVFPRWYSEYNSSTTEQLKYLVSILAAAVEDWSDHQDIRSFRPLLGICFLSEGVESIVQGGDR